MQKSTQNRIMEHLPKQTRCPVSQTTLFPICTPSKHSRKTFLRLLATLESQFLEEVVASSSLLLAGDSLLVQVLVFENLLEPLLDFNLALCVSEVSLVNTLLEVHVDDIPSREHMTDIHILDKRLHGLRSLLDLGLGHATGDLTGSAGEASDEAVRKTLVIIVAIFIGLYDDGLLAGVTSSEDDNDLSTLCTGKKWRNSERNVKKKSTTRKMRGSAFKPILHRDSHKNPCILQQVLAYRLAPWSSTKACLNGL